MKATDVMNNKAELIKILGNIANIHRDKGQRREALEYYEKVLAYKVKMGNDKEIAIKNYCIAEELNCLGEHHSAFKCLHAAISILPSEDELQRKYLLKLKEVEA